MTGRKHIAQTPSARTFMELFTQIGVQTTQITQRSCHPPTRTSCMSAHAGISLPHDMGLGRAALLDRLINRIKPYYIQYAVKNIHSHFVVFVAAANPLVE